MKSFRLTIAVMFALFMGANAALAGGDAAAGEGKAASCGMCHGAAGEGTPMGPKLAGMDEAAFIEAMEAFKSGARENAMMQGAAASLEAQDFADLAAYFAGLGSE